ncbi:uncharacterized protein LOC143201568 isoform X1 [Rhynchophorus ferrugineus]|uniref:uncharacterized protein LOC143201568 isoform X1 n=1 Tax=Rhynchophorus ferrugineus TaxID=354439 RepID=UPI003FCD82BE
MEVFVFIIFVFFEISSCSTVYPDIFHIENYTKCMETRNNSFCMVNVEITLGENKVPVPFQHLDMTYNRSKIHRGVCVPSHLREDLRRFYIDDKLKVELKGFQINGTIINVDCDDKRIFTTLQITTVILFGLYLCLVGYATYKDVFDQEESKNSWHRFISLKYNYRALFGRKDPDFQRLLSMQGFRTYHTCLVIACHCILFWATIYIKNPDYMEEISPSLESYFLTSHFMVVVQPFFVISAWIMTNKILELHKRNGCFSLGDIARMFVNRFFRFLPALSVMVFATTNHMSLFCRGPQTLEIFNILNEGCRRHWWMTILHVANMVSFNEMCNPGLWSISIDTQYYVFNMVMLYVILKYKWSFIKTVSGVSTFFYIRNLWMFYSNDFPVLYRIDLEGAKTSVFFNNLALDQAYFGFSVNWGSSLIGVLFGYLYYNRKNCTMIEKWERRLVLVFSTLPIMTVFLGLVQFDKLGAAMVGPLLKPLYSLGIACGIYVMSRGILRGRVASIFENKFVVSLGNFTFCTYVFHFGIILLKYSRMTELVEIHRITIIASYLIDVVVSFTIGILMTLVVEQPGNQIQKMLLPQNSIGKKQKDSLNKRHDD